jgi:hypothetical protein
MIRYSTGLQRRASFELERAKIERLMLLLVPTLQLRYSPGQAVAIGDAMWNAAGISIDNFILEGRSGAQPLTADLAPTGTVLFSITLPADSMAATASPGATTAKAGTWQDASADANGTAGWFRIRAAGDAGTTNNTDRRIDGAITGTGGGGELELQNVVIAITQQITVTSATFTQPKQ